MSRKGPFKPGSRFVKEGESGSVRLVRTVCKSFERHGSEEAGVMTNFAAFLNEINSQSKLISFKGNRFNVLFWNGAATYYHKSNFESFFCIHGVPNRLLRAVKEDLEDIIHVAGCRALGIIDKLITGPFWRVLEKDEPYVALNDRFHHMQIKFQEWAEEATPLLNEERLFQDVEVHKDCLYKAVFKETNDTLLDTLTVEAIELIMSQFCLVVVRQLSEHLPGGSLSNITEKLQEETRYAPKTNQLGESVFGTMDYLMRQRPSASDVNLASTIMYRYNHTGSWLSTLSSDEKSKLMATARKRARLTIETFGERRKEVKKRIFEKMMKKKERKGNERG
ncbi:hypothetical protein HOLleu_44637 [Holothuria leucospilota]|uniref:Uncharacterized protein n=1 Tax=Holothuria leucospilota TaxID=206669 RepID=A0A9Q0YAI7_HOLLE|nr:hypothetical protein HOLleu_44637 [Holothuria leucospilota]